MKAFIIKIVIWLILTILILLGILIVLKLQGIIQEKKFEYDPILLKPDPGNLISARDRVVGILHVEFFSNGLFFVNEKIKVELSLKYFGRVVTGTAAVPVTLNVNSKIKRLRPPRGVLVQ